MSDGRNAIRIEDLAYPVLSDLQRGVQPATASPPVSMTVEVLNAARDATGPTDFGAEDFRERLQVWLTASQPMPA